MIKASLVLVIAFCLTWLLRRRAAAERHMVWVAAIVSAGALPILGLLLPSWQPVFAQRIASALPAIPATGAGSNLARQADVIFHAEGIETGVAARVWPLVWIAGSAIGLLILGTGIFKQKWLARRSSALFEPVIVSMASELAQELGCPRTVQLRRSFIEAMPMTWGILRPQILLPRCAGAWSDERKHVVIAHELAHVQRYDRLFQMVAQIACCVYWFNPLFWIASNRLYGESERACDDAVINLGVDARKYAAHLLGIARSLRQSGSWSAALAMARQSTLEKRFAALLESKMNRRGPTRRTIFSTVIVTLFLVLPLAAMRVSRPAALTTVLDETPDGERDAALTDSVSPRIDQYTTPPLYSDEARSRGIEGVVSVEVRVGIDGTVQHLQVLKRLGHGLDENALVAVRDWLFVPAMRNGVPIEATTQIDVEFDLRNAELNEEIANDMATRIGPGVSPPQVVHRVEPSLSAGMREAPAGAVVLDAVILEDGSPKIVRVIRSLDWELDEIAIDALNQWRFSPATKNGRPVKVRMNIAVGFQSGLR